ncbi:hypothetical protein AAFJ72_20555 [Brevibacillus gelatini]|uniref:hypothetical protein n=1 Tax=Brevibacillus gelatini TaxID=1655277 RepID=UPI003D816C61
MYKTAKWIVATFCLAVLVFGCEVENVIQNNLTIDGFIFYATLMKKYKSKISQDGFKNGEQAFSVIGSDGRKYKLVIKGGKVITFYPDGWNIAKIE